MAPLVQLWPVRVYESDFELACGLLTATELARNEKFRNRPDRLRHAIARGALRTVLGKKLGAHPQEIHFEIGPHGKPGIAGARMGFNLSHAGDWVWIASADGCDVGVDIERIRAGSAKAEIIRRFGSPEEYASFGLIPAEDRDLAFFAWWTRKEAYLKGLGCGIMGDPRASTVWTGTGEAKVIEDWTVLSLEAPFGYSGGLAVKAATVRVEVCGWSW